LQLSSRLAALLDKTVSYPGRSIVGFRGPSIEDSLADIDSDTLELLQSGKVDISMIGVPTAEQYVADSQHLGFQAVLESGCANLFGLMDPGTTNEESGSRKARMAP
jgi:hypothetical protein